METAWWKQEGGWVQGQAPGGWRVCEGHGQEEASRRPPRGDCTLKPGAFERRPKEDLSLDTSARPHRPHDAPSPAAPGSGRLSALCSVAQSCPTLFDPIDCSPPGSSVHRNSPGNNTGVGCHALLQGIFPTQGLNPGLSHCRWILYQLSHQGSQGLGHGLRSPRGGKESDANE